MNNDTNSTSVVSENTAEHKKVFGKNVNRLNVCLIVSAIILIILLGFISYGYSRYRNLQDENSTLKESITKLENSNQYLIYQVNLLKTEDENVNEAEDKVIIRTIKPSITWSVDSIDFTIENAYLAPKVLGLKSGTNDYSADKSYFILEIKVTDKRVGGEEREILTRDYIYLSTNEGKLLPFSESDIYTNPQEEESYYIGFTVPNDQENFIMFVLDEESDKKEIVDFTSKDVKLFVGNLHFVNGVDM